jgi:hypothetical protein
LDTASARSAAHVGADSPAADEAAILSSCPDGADNGLRNEMKRTLCFS